MKKFYYLFMVGLLAICLVPPQQSFSQNNVCPTPNPPLVTHIVYNASLCVVYVDRMWPNSPVTLFDLNLQIISIVQTDATGYACIVYPCNRIPFRVTSCINDTVNNIHGCCSGLVPAAALLPIKLTAFNVRLNSDKSIGLAWRSEFEANSDKYVVERSADGYSFSEVGKVTAAGSSSRAINYSFTDRSFGSGAAYYRLRQVDLDGKTEYSKVVYINNKNAVGIITKIFPNPFTNDIQLIGLSSSELTRMNVQVFNTMGQRIDYKITGANAIALGEDAPRGMYILKVKDQQFKLIKQ